MYVPSRIKYSPTNPLSIGRPREESAINRKNADRRSLARCQREERQAKAHHAVSAHLEEHTGKNHRTRSWRFDVRVRQPCVQREKRHLNSKRQEECQE